MKKEQDCSGRRKKSKSLAAFVLLAHLLAQDEERIAIPCCAGTNIPFKDHLYGFCRMIAIARKRIFYPVLETQLEFVPLGLLCMCIEIRLLQILTLTCCNKFIH
jgi:hypothetical protein